jgi:hypothetical protein
MEKKKEAVRKSPYSLSVLPPVISSEARKDGGQDAQNERAIR